jgi:glycosyltransferase involved in cell wall biosynthesis
MKDLAILIPAWQAADILPVCLKAIRLNCKSDYTVFVVLNEVDDLSLSICRQWGVKFLALDSNEGTLAIDYFMPHLTDYKFTMTINCDMIVPENYDLMILSKLLEIGELCSVSSPAVEYNGGNDGITAINDSSLPPFRDTEVIDKFSNNVKSGKYVFPTVYSQRHPITTWTSTYKKCGGFSDNFDRGYFAHTLDFDFGFRLWNLGCKMISLGSAPVLHDYSSTMKKLSPELQQWNGWDHFRRKNGMSVDEFKRKMNFHKKV